MSHFYKCTYALLIALSFFLKVQAQSCSCDNYGSELVSNGDFSSGNLNFVSDYFFSSTAGHQKYGITTDPHLANIFWPNCTDHTSGTGNLMWVDGSDTASLIAWSEVIFNLDTNKDYLFSCWVNTLDPNYVPAILNFSINGISLDSPFVAPSSTCDWVQFCAKWNSGNATSATVAITDENLALFGNDFALDDISFRQCCKPATITPSGTVSFCSGSSVLLSANGDIGISYQWIKGAQNIPGQTNQTFTATKTAKYKVKEISVLGCVSTSAPTSIIALALPDASIVDTIGSTDLCDNNSVTLIANSGVGVSYQWKKGNNILLGATNLSYSTTKKGSYAVVVTNSGGCSKTSPTVKVIKSCKMSSARSDVDVTIHPNPSNGNFTVNLRNITEEPVTIKMFDILGKEVFSEDQVLVEGISSKDIHLRNLPSGIYFLKVMHDGESEISKIVIEN